MGKRKMKSSLEKLYNMWGKVGTGKERSFVNISRAFFSKETCLFVFNREKLCEYQSKNLPILQSPV
jgi:hypothetical protein